MPLSWGQANPGIFPFQGCATLRQGAKGWAFPNSLCSNRVINGLEAFLCAINTGLQNEILK